ncbi:retinol dehydrogenase 7-like [Rhincodon typus]|uniref:retinol dehydrogenase 7-like n=1 Tax=Rhincodon typus TaxID=259920 RepID=UPI0009A3CFC5|nr:retinol dehydrogenase 7-like [Rhincodon typus]XP_048455488.1 retinol dehydrogenase 7-like [Rhincodon typus]XP_048455489.1 retinol dehydrogenase 7-like [Rhincodon typus]
MLQYLIICVLLYVLYYRYRDSQCIKNVSDKYVYITGCDSGFGNLLAKHLDEQGFHVLAACFTEKGAEELKECTSSRLKTFQLDIVNSESIIKAAEFVKSEVKEKGLWGLVNNAGISLPAGPSDWLTIDDYKAVLNVNLIGLIEVTLSVLPLIKRARGRIVNVASIFGKISCMGGPYCISKYGVEAFNDGLRRDLSEFGVKVLCIEPGFFKTNMTNLDLITDNFKKIWFRLPQDVKDDYGADYLDKVKHKLKTRLAKLADPNLMKVVWCMNHALTSVHPRTRYSAGRDAKLFWIPLSYMPTIISDIVLRLDKVKSAKCIL